MLLVTQRNQAATNQRPGCQIEGGIGLGLGQAFGLGARIRLTAQVVLLQRETDVGLGDVLHRLPVVHHEAGADRFMTGHNAVQRPAQRAAVEHATQVHANGHVVGGAGAVELRQEPQPLLRER